MKHLFSRKREKEIVQSYLGGLGSGYLARKYRTTRKTICTILHRRGIERRSRSDASRRTSIDSRVFSVLSEEARYWIGFLLTDGCISYRAHRSPIITVAVAKEDRSHLELFRGFLGSDAKIGTTNQGRAVRLSVHSREIADRLARFGITSRKTGSESCPDSLLHDRDFWRGAFDGDGWFTSVKRKFPEMGFCGSEILCTQFLQFVRTHEDTNASVRKIAGANCHKVSFRTRVSVNLSRILYDGCSVALERKLHQAHQIMERWGGDNSLVMVKPFNIGP